MKKASKFFSTSQQATVIDAVRNAEENSAGEIVPVIATSSGRYDRAEDIFGLLCGLLTLSAGWLFCPAFHPPLDWESAGALQSVNGLLPAIVAVVAGFLIGSILATRFPVLRLPFIPAAEMEAEVGRAAHAAFAKHRIHRTDGATGILLYVSLYEHRVVILPDDGIGAAADHQVWEQVRDKLLAGIRAGKPEEGFVEAIAVCGEILSAHCPRKEDDKNELSNEIVFVD